MLASGSPANASSAAARIAATLRSASRRRRRGVVAGAGAAAGLVFFVTSVNGHRAWIEAKLGHEVAGVGEDGESDQAGETSQRPGCHERVGDPGCSVRAA